MLGSEELSAANALTHKTHIYFPSVVPVMVRMCNVT